MTVRLPRQARDRWGRPRLLARLALGVATCCLLAACGKSSQGTGGGTTGTPLAPVTKQGAVSVVTRNTSRIGGANAASDAAAVARAVYPGLTPTSRPQAVVLVSTRDWNAALAASVLAGAPAGAPVLFSEGSSVPEVTSEAIEALHPTGLAALGGAQVIRVGTAASVPTRLATHTLPAAGAAATAAEVERVQRRLAGGAPPSAVLVMPAEAPRALAMPAAGLAAQSGAPILYVRARHVPPPTLQTLGTLHNPTIYVVDPAGVGEHAISVLRRFGRVTTIAPPPSTAAAGGAAVANSIALARFTDGSFGWGVKEPGHGLVFANAGRPLDGPAAALLSASAQYGPLLLVEEADTIPVALQSYLIDIQPAYTSAPAYRPVRGVYNHGWLIGDEKAISAVAQAEFDSLLEISPSRQNVEETSGEP